MMVDSLLEIIAERVSQKSYFLFRTNVRKGYLDKSNFRHCYSNFFKGAIRKVTWSQLWSKFLLKNYKARRQQHFERHHQLKISRTWIKRRTNSFTKTWLNIIKRKLSLAKNYDPSPQRTLHQNRWYFTYFYALLFCQTNLVFKSNLVFINILDSFCHSLFTF